MITNGTDFGKAFSEVSVLHETRLAQINSILDAARNLYYALDQEIAAETLATNNASIKEGEWDKFRGNNVSPNQSGINDEVQSKGAALWDAIDAI
jgi:hypothetical protein